MRRLSKIEGKWIGSGGHQEPHPNLVAKGGAKRGGRKPGQVNKVPKLLKEALMIAAELEGSNEKGKDGLTGFLRKMAREDLRSFAMLLGRIIPLQINTKGDSASRSPTATWTTCVQHWLIEASR